MSSGLDTPRGGAGTFDGSQESKRPKDDDASVRDPSADEGVEDAAPPRNQKAEIQKHADQFSNGIQAENADKPVSTEQAEKARMLPGDLKDEAAISEDEAPPENAEGLGSILKGSPFEDEESKQKAAGQKTSTQRVQPSAPSVKDSKGIKEDTAQRNVKAHGPKQPPQQRKATQNPSSQVPPAQEHRLPTMKPAKPSTGTPSELKKATGHEIPKKAPPSVTQTQEDPTLKNSDSRQQAKLSIKSPSLPRMPNSPRVPPNQSAPKATSPKTTATPSKAGNQTNGQSKKAPSKISDTVKNSAKGTAGTAKAASSKPSTSASSTSNAPKKNALASTGSTKPRPKSPTKPFKLPSSATAPTASSAAKHDGESGDTPSRPPSRQSNASSVPKGQIASVSKPTRPLRASLPANSRPLEKPKVKLRPSLAANSAAAGGFLERMMRPTQSSAQKISEKIEPTSPPRRNTHSGTHTAKPKRKSGESSSTKSEKEEVKSEQLIEEEPPSRTEQTDAKPLPLADGASPASEEIAREIESAAPPSTSAGS